MENKYANAPIHECRIKLGSILKTLRQHLGMTREDAAKRVGIPGRAWSAVESGSRNIDEKLVAIVAKVLELPDDKIQNFAFLCARARTKTSAKAPETSPVYDRQKIRENLTTVRLVAFTYEMQKLHPDESARGKWEAIRTAITKAAGEPNTYYRGKLRRLAVEYEKRNAPRRRRAVAKGKVASL